MKTGWRVQLGYLGESELVLTGRKGRTSAETEGIFWEGSEIDPEECRRKESQLHSMVHPATTNFNSNVKTHA